MNKNLKISLIAVFALSFVVASFPVSANASHDRYDDYRYNSYDCYWANDCHRHSGTSYYGVYLGDNRFNVSPDIESRPRDEARVGERYTYNVDAYDRDGDRLFYFLEKGPRGMTIDARDGFLEWYPDADQADTIQHVLVGVEDQHGNETSQSFSIYVEGPRNPVLATPTPVAPTVVEVPVTRTIVVRSQPTTVVGSVSGINTAALEQYNIRTITDENGNVFVSWETNKPSRGRVSYGLASQSTKGENFVYEYTSPDSGAVATIHSVMLGQLQMERTYYFRVISEIGNERRISSEHSFIRVTGGIGSIASTNNVALGSALGVIGSLFFSPIILLLIILALVIAVVLRRRKKKVRIIEPAKIEIA